MKLALFILLLCVTPTASPAQLLNGSFENGQGDFDATGWTATCGGTFPEAGAPGFGDQAIAVPHGESNGCSGSFLIQLMPDIHNGETWTLTGWCYNFLYNISDPYIGIRMGVKYADGSYLYNTPALMSSGIWTGLSVTNTFTLSTGDTAYVMCDAGTVSGFGLGTYAVFDGLALTNISTGVTALPQIEQAWRYDATNDQLIVAAAHAPLCVDALGRPVTLPIVSADRGSMRFSTATLKPGMFVVGDGLRSLRFVKN